MTVVDRNVLDITYIEDNKYILEIIDYLEWNFATRREHGQILQNKINDYLDYIASGEASRAKPGLRVVIRIVSKYSYSKYCIEFLERVKKFIKEKDDICDIEWTHSKNDGPFNDGFSDDYVFDKDKIYPRIKKNWAKNPKEEVSLMAFSNDYNYPDNLVLFKFWDSYIETFVVDLGDKFTYFTYDMLPENITPEQLESIAFDNLSKNIEYKWCETNEKGIYGILAGGNFEAESICSQEIWKEISDTLEDDVIISIPTKDIVFYTKLNDKKLKNKMIGMAKKMFDDNRNNSPYLIFSKDIFIYSRENNEITISSKYSL